MKKNIRFLGTLFLGTLLLFITKQEVSKSQETDLVDIEIQEKERERRRLLEEVNREMAEERRERERKKLEEDKNYITYDQMLQMSEDEKKEHGIRMRRRVGVSAEELIELGVDPELVDKYRGSNFQINIIEKE